VCLTLVPECGEARLTVKSPAAGASDAYLAGRRCFDRAELAALRRDRSLGSGLVETRVDDPQWQELVRLRRELAERLRASVPYEAERERQAQEHRRKRSERASCGRARREASQIATAHRCDILVTATTKRRCASLAKYRELLNELGRRLSAWRSMAGLVAVGVPEPHPEGHGWHSHLLINRWAHHAPLRAMWRAICAEAGYVSGGLHITKVRSMRRVKLYVTKYVNETMSPEYIAAAGVIPRKMGQHRYWCHNAVAPQGQRWYFASEALALAWVREVMGEPERTRAFSLADGGITGQCLWWPEGAWWPPPPTVADLAES
jgi:hypothetical protein